MLPNEEFALACRAYYEEQGLIVDATNGQFAHCPLPRDECDTGYYLLWEHHQHQGLLQSRDVGRKCFFNGYAKKWLLTADCDLDNLTELWSIYREYSGKNDTRLWEGWGNWYKSDASKKVLDKRDKKCGEMAKARVKKVLVRWADGQEKIFPSAKETADFLEVGVGRVYSIINGTPHRQPFTISYV